MRKIVMTTLHLSVLFIACSAAPLILGQSTGQFV